MEHLSSYYFNGRAFVKRNKWAKRFKSLLATIFVISAITYTVEPSFAHLYHYQPVTHRFENYIRSSNPRVSLQEAKEITNAVLRWGSEFNIDPKLLLATAKVESGFNKHAISSSGAYGIMQVIPVWHKSKVLDARKVLGNPEVFNINTNIYLGSRVLHECGVTSSIRPALQCYSGRTPGYDSMVIKEYNAIKYL